ncbi:MAG TPA: exopolysaccharide biosynthesis polyprenyl glycosylphosphotransferase [Jiangellales bacterium]|nr:exopolysaccharide biosynthesis polyprenyl glycosylphosphotransferase [Jiangellales bacterium]
MTPAMPWVATRPAAGAVTRTALPEAVRVTAPGGRAARLAAGLLPAVDGAALATAVSIAGVPWPLAALYVSTVLVVLHCLGQYRVRICLRLGDELPRLVGGTVGPLLLLVLLHVPILPLAPLAVGLIVAGRACHYHLLRICRQRCVVRETALVVGADLVGARVFDLLVAHPELGLSPCGFVDSRAVESESAVSVLGDVSAVSDVVAERRIRRVIVCFPDAPDTLLVQALRGLPADVCVVPRLHTLGIRAPLGCLDEIWGIPLVPLRRAGRAGLVVKRATDLFLGTLLLVAVAPVLLAVALAVRLSSGLPATFRQVRLTWSGRRIAILKLRTLAPQRDSDTRWAVDRTSYLHFGAFLRSTHLDELPQLVNVIRGDMSLVGPRPERPFFAELFAERIPDYVGRHRMPAGITGWAQIHGLHGETSIEERVRFDNQYIEYWSPWRDLVILARTLTNLFSDRIGGSR